jgi:hypothetical protein
LGEIAHRPDSKIDGTIDLAEAGTSLAGSRIIHDGEKLKGRRGCAAVAVAVAKRELHPLVVELAFDAKPLFVQSAPGQGRSRQPERLRGSAGQFCRIQRSGCEVCRRS